MKSSSSGVTLVRDFLVHMLRCSLSSFASRSKLRSCCAIAFSGLLLSAGLPCLAADADDTENWIKETGSPGESVSPSSSSLATGTRKVAQSLGSATAAPKAVPSGAPATVPSSNHSSTESSSTSAASTPLLRGGVTYCVPSGTPLKLKLATVPMPELKGELKDMEGKYNPAQLDQVITAKITEDIYVDDNKVIPEGTVFHGRVSKIIAPRHVGRDGSLEISFDRFVTPDGRSFAFRAEADNHHDSTMKSKGKGALVIAEHAAGGAAVGVLVAYKLFGLQNTIAMHGYNIAGGAAVGAAGGIAWALWRRGDKAVLEPGDEFSMHIDKDLLIPGATAPTPKKPPITIKGFDLQVLSKKTVKDGFGGYMIRVDAELENFSHKKLSSLDLFLEDDNGNRDPVCPDVDVEAEELFYVQPLSRQRILCSFAVQFPKLKHKIVWLDHNTHQKIFEQKL